MPKIAGVDGHKIHILHQVGHSQRENRKQTGHLRYGVKAVVKKLQDSEKVRDNKRRESLRKVSPLSDWTQHLLQSGEARSGLVFVGG